MKHSSCIIAAIGLLGLSSCSSHRLQISAIGYQSVRPERLKSVNDPATQSADIVVAYTISADGVLTGVIKNNTDEIMVIDQTKSTFVNTDGSSHSYYDPSVHTTSVTNHSSSTSGADVNLGSVAGFFGIGGALGDLLSGVNVGGSSTNGQSVTNTTYTQDLPQVSIGSHGSVILSKSFQITGIGYNAIQHSGNVNFSCEERARSPLKFNVSIIYSTDGGKSFDKITTNFFVNSSVIIPVNSNYNINNELRNIYKIKNGAIYEPWWTICLTNNIGGFDRYHQGVIIDYK